MFFFPSCEGENEHLLPEEAATTPINFYQISEQYLDFFSTATIDDLNDSKWMSSRIVEFYGEDSQEIEIYHQSLSYLNSNNNHNYRTTHNYETPADYLLSSGLDSSTVNVLNEIHIKVQQYPLKKGVEYLDSYLLKPELFEIEDTERLNVAASLLIGYKVYVSIAYQLELESTSNGRQIQQEGDGSGGPLEIANEDWNAYWDCMVGWNPAIIIAGVTGCAGGFIAFGPGGCAAAGTVMALIFGVPASIYCANTASGSPDQGSGVCTGSIDLFGECVLEVVH